LLTYFFNIHGWCRFQIFHQVDFSLRQWEARHCHPGSAALAPACAMPSAAAASSAEGSFTHANQSMAVPFASLPSSIVPGLAFSRFPAALQGHVFAPLSATVPQCHGQTAVSDRVGDLGVRGSRTRLQRWISKRGRSQKGNRSREASRDEGDYE